MLFKFIICFIAGIGAGLGTGFAGMSAAAVIAPMLITFLQIPAYQAVDAVTHPLYVSLREHTISFFPDHS